MLTIILKLILYFLLMGLLYSLFLIAKLVIVELKNSKEAQDSKAHYSETLKSENVIKIIKNLKETPYNG